MHASWSWLIVSVLYLPMQVCSLLRFPLTFRNSIFSSVRYQSDNSSDTTTGNQSLKKGVIVGNSPLKVRCEEGKKYSWCSCGLSVKQPLCDGTHKNSSCGMKPVVFTAPQTKEYLFCNCKQTNKRPFCDGSHKKLT